MEERKKHLTRRKFLATSAALSAGALLPGSLAAETKKAATQMLPMPTKILGKTGERVSVLGFGSALNVTPPLLNSALSEEITFLDTAQGYTNGNSEKNIGAILEKTGRRKDCFIVTKSGDHSVEGFATTLEQDSLPRLRTDYVDLYYLHNLGSPDRLDDEMKQTAERLKKEKKIRFFGFSSHHDNLIPTLNKAAEVGFVDAIMLKYNFRDYDNAELDKALDKCAAAGIGLVAMKTQGGAVSFQDRVDPFEAKGLNKFQATLKAVWADDRIHTVVSAMKNLKQLRENAQAARNPDMGLLERQLLDEYAAETNHLYCRGCGHNCEGCVNAPLQIADTLRYRMYSENYGDREEARLLFSQLPARARAIDGVDFSAAEAACPYNVPIGALMRDAAAKLT